MSTKSVRLFFKYNNDNNPFRLVTITSQTVFGGFSLLGGYIKIFGLLKFALYLYNKSAFERNIFRKYKSQIADTALELESQLYFDSREELPFKKREGDELESPFKSYLQRRGRKEIDVKTMRDMLSYELFMLLVIEHLTLERDKRKT
jgi:hypothetical protein